MHLQHPLSGLASAALDLVAPPRCLSCAADDPSREGLCPRCAARLVVNGPAPCPICAAPLGPGAPVWACSACPLVRPRFRACLAPVRYAGLGGELVRRAKYGADPLFAVPLVRRLVLAAIEWPPARRVDEVISVPSTPRRRRERGFNLAEVFAEPVARALHRPFRPRRLRRVGDPLPQASLTRTERRLAARGTVAVHVPHPAVRILVRHADLRGRAVLLVDDVMTTGATANACARELLTAGARSVVLAVATRA